MIHAATAASELVWMSENRNLKMDIRKSKPDIWKRKSENRYPNIGIRKLKWKINIRKLKSEIENPKIDIENRIRKSEYTNRNPRITFVCPPILSYCGCYNTGSEWWVLDRRHETNQRCLQCITEWQANGLTTPCQSLCDALQYCILCVILMYVW